MKKNTILIIDAGINGLACGLTLLEQGYPVSIYANTFTPNTASSAAPAVWMQFKAQPSDLVAKWLQHTFTVCEALTKNPETGIDLLSYKEFYPTQVTTPCWLLNAGRQYQAIGAKQIPARYQSGFESSIYRMDSTLLLPFLQKKFLELGGHLHHRYFADLNAKELQVPIIVNCMGAHTTDVVTDAKAYPIRGQYIIIDKIKGLNTTYICFLDDERYIGIVPRRNDCWLGGTTNYHSWDADIHQDTTQFILTEAAKIVPEIATKNILEVNVKFRSGRSEIRLEKEILPDGRVIIHNYGHGGSGFSLSFGCAKDVAALLA